MQSIDYCVRCGRLMPARKKDRNPGKYCSKRCRRNPIRDLDRELERTIVALLGVRAGGATICPSEAARRVRETDWRPLMEPTRQAARRLWCAGRIEILQRGRVVEPSRAAGPIRLRLARSWVGR